MKKHVAVHLFFHRQYAERRQGEVHLQQFLQVRDNHSAINQLQTIVFWSLIGVRHLKQFFVKRPIHNALQGRLIRKKIFNGAIGNGRIAIHQLLVN